MQNEVRPHQLLPLLEPKLFNPSKEDPNFFYENFASQFIEDMIRMTNAGLRIDNNAVESLRRKITSVLKDVEKRLGRNPTIRAYQEVRAKKMQKQHAKKATQSIRVLGDFLRPYNRKDITHRTWVVNTHLIQRGFKERVKEKWTMKDLKSYCMWEGTPYLEAIIDGKDITEYKKTIEGMRALAEHKLELWNRPRYNRLDNAKPVNVKFDPTNALHVAMYKKLEGEENERANSR